MTAKSNAYLRIVPLLPQSVWIVNRMRGGVTRFAWRIFMSEEKWSARFRSHDEIRSRGAIGNLNDGSEITTQGVRTRLSAWLVNGFQTEPVEWHTLRARSDVSAEE